ncbi:MAG: YbjN domain-containing protein [Cyclobacteriaceae bacterium]|nr:YbjN domain-containing protein [Cyclobacteriaceae bacterium]
MNDHFEKVQGFLLDLEFSILSENEEDGVFRVDNEDAGIHNLVIGCLDPILVMEQFLFEIKNDSNKIYKSLLIKNRDIIHGAFVLDETGKKVIFRDTLQLENLDQNELEGSLNSLSLLMSEYSEELIKFSKN